MGREVNFPMIGMLKADDGMPEAVFVNKVDEVQFRIKALSPIPKAVYDVWKGDTNAIYFNGFMTNVAEWAQHKDSKSDSLDEIAEKFKKFLKSKLVIFKVSIDSGHLNIAKDSIKLIDKPKGINLKSEFNIIPIINMSDIEFQSRILNGGQIPMNFIEIQELPNLDSINYVYNNGYLYGKFEGNELGKLQTVTFKWLGSDVKRLAWDITDESDKIINKLAFVWDEKIIFMEDSCQQLLGRDKEFKLFTPIEKEIVDSLKLASINTDDKVVEKAIAKTDDTETKEVKDIVVGTLIETNEKKTIIRITFEDEVSFIKRLQETAKDNLLFYDDRTLINFHTAMKTGGLVILNGISGTGKTKLATIYKEALGLSDSQFKMVSVKPNWSDDSDVLGFMDVANNIYRPAESGIIDTLREAELNPEKIYIICFDEMNLARVEYYFSQFLSRLEMSGTNRKIVLYNKDRETSLYNSSRYPAEISLGDNVFFIGTINTDETTQAFSDKVLDRANLIHTGVLSFVSWKNNLDKWKDEWLHKDTRQKLDEISMKQYDMWINRDPFIELEDKELKFFDEMNSLLAEYINKPIGYRVIAYIDRYIKNIPVFALTSFFDRGYALDLQVVQRILPKVRGTIGELQELIGTGNYSSKLEELFNRYSSISKFELSRKMLNTKKKELQSHGYTS